MPRRNRIDPWSDLHAASGRGLLTGNRGCLVDDEGTVVRHHHSPLWISCVTEFRDWRHPLAAPHRWTPIFFLDDAVALAAGHRPCAFCRRDAYRSYRDAVTKSLASTKPLLAAALDRRLVEERHRRGRGLDRADDRLVWEARIDELPSGTVVVDDDRHTRLLIADRMLMFTFDGWTDPTSRPYTGTAHVLTPPTSVAALANGFTPLLHPSATSP
ncbi:MAG TPA: hypothetical protein VNO51_21440 [Ilumatobacteraceae bacterium]|nr:hypothetical protein [Ilumatobacteraceae bacterium]